MINWIFRSKERICTRYSLFSLPPSSCGVHLLPYSALIETSFVQGLTLASSPSPPPHLLLSLHRALSGWVRVRGDSDHNTLAPIVTWLLVEGRRVRARGKEGGKPCMYSD